MPEMTGYRPGVPCWADLSTGEREAALAFYGRLFEWDAVDLGEETGHYTMFTRAGRQVAAATSGPVAVPPHWTTYFSVADADDTARRIEASGGKVLDGPTDVMTAGRMAVFADPTGAVAALWQPGDHIGAQLVNEPGSVVWNELNTSDPDRARSFYGDVLGWDWAGSPDYAEARIDDRPVAGVMARPETMPAGVPDHWLVYFASANLDRDVERVPALGGSVAVGPMDIEGTGRFAIVVDPHGAAFGLFEG